MRFAYHKWKYPAAIFLLLSGLVFSKALLSLASPILFIIIILDDGGTQRILNSLKKPLVIVLISVFFLHLLSLLWSTNMQYGLHDIKTKIFLLVFPVLLASIPPISKQQAYSVVKAFIYFVGMMSIINIVRYFVLPHDSNYNPVFEHSHIRFSLIICLALFMTAWLFSQKAIKKNTYILVWITIVILIVFLILIESFTGYVVFAALLPISAFLFRKYIKSLILKFIIATILLSTLVYGVYTVYMVKKEFFPTVDFPETSELDAYSDAGHPYLHDESSTLTENGFIIYYYICYDELIREWNRRSTQVITGDSIIIKANLLLRYMTSKGLRKDSVGVWQLSDEDIKNIENGISNYKLPHQGPIRTRLYKFFWELNVYRNTKDPSGHSLTQRIEYWKTAVYIIKQNFWFGVGAGDVGDAFAKAYEDTNSSLEEQYRLRAHNQFITFWIAFGLLGFLLFIFSLAYPFFFAKYRRNILYIGFMFIFLLSMLNEDTLETQVGVTFYAFFNALILFVIQPAVNGKSD